MEMLFGVQRRWILSICFLGRAKVLQPYRKGWIFSLFILGFVSHTRREVVPHGDLLGTVLKCSVPSGL